MATASSLQTSGISARRINNAWDNIAAAQTDSILVAAKAGKSIRIIAVFANGRDAGGASTFTFNSKPAGAGSAISPTFTVPQNGGFVLPDSGGWFETAVGEGLSVTTAAASALSILVVFEVD